MLINLRAGFEDASFRRIEQNCAGQPGSPEELDSDWWENVSRREIANLDRVRSAARAILRWLASALVVLDRNSGITGGVSAGTKDLFAWMRSEGILAVRQLTPFSVERPRLSIKSLCVCYPRRFTGGNLPRRGDTDGGFDRARDALNRLGIKVGVHGQAENTFGGALGVGKLPRAMPRSA